MSDGHKTSTITRPRTHPDTPARATRPSRSKAGPRPQRDDTAAQRRSDFTTPIPVSKQLVPQKRGRLVLVLFATVITAAIGAVLFVFPVQSWMQQRDDLGVRQNQLATLTSANDDLQTEVDRLQTDAGIMEAAREEIDYVEEGEHRVTVLAMPPGPLTLPTGWPYNLVTQIVALRLAEAEAATATTTTGGP